MKTFNSINNIGQRKREKREKKINERMYNGN
jgi:hypothetical protein